MRERRLQGMRSFNGGRGCDRSRLGDVERGDRSDPLYDGPTEAPAACREATTIGARFVTRRARSMVYDGNKPRMAQQYDWVIGMPTDHSA